MDYAARIWGVSLSEMRSASRLARTWLFVVIGLLITVPAYLGSAFSHYNLGAFEPYLSMVSNVRYIFAAQIGGSLILVYSIGIVFLAFDIRVRDKNARMHEVLESRPIDNFGFLLGRTLGITFIALLPILVTMFLALIIAFATQFNVAFQVAIPQPHSFWQFILIDLVPNIFFYAAFVVFLAMVLRFRLLVIIFGIGFMVLLFYVAALMPYQLSDVLTWMSVQEYPSDVRPFFTNTLTLLERLAIIVFSLGMLYLATLAHHRHDGYVHARVTALGVGLVVVGCLGFYGVYLNSVNEADDRLVWTNEHLKVDQSFPNTSLDVKELTGSIDVNPGSILQAQYSLSVEVIDTNGTEGLLFSFNPAMDIEEIRLDGSTLQDFEFENGLLVLNPKTFYPIGSKHEIELVAEGVPDELFQYLDSGIDLYGNTAFTGINLRLLGQFNSIFTSDVVALPPDAAWYPQAGPHVNRDQITRRPRDFFTVDLQINLPEDWVVAGPREQNSSLSQGGVASYRINPKIPVPSLALVADEFHRVAAEIEGITFELLFHPKHTKNLAIFADLKDEIVRDIEERLRTAARFGLDYPFSTLSLVEVPANLKIFGGGWRMDTVQSQPGILFMRELNFPTTSFVKQTNFENRTEWDEETQKEYKFGLLESFLRNDLLGGNIFLGFVRNLFVFQTGATGSGAEALDFTVEALVNQLVVGDSGFFSAYMMADANPTGQGTFLSSSTQATYTGRQAPTVSTSRVREMVFNTNSTWESAMDYPLNKLPFSEDPGTSLKVLEMKGNKLASAIIDGLGKEEAGEIVSHLIKQHQGTSYTYDDLRQISADLEIPIDQVVGDWLNDIKLPGYLVSSGSIVRVSDDASNQPRYQTSFHLHNGEDVPGVVTAWYTTGSQEVNSQTNAITIPPESSIRINLISQDPLTEVGVQPYLSLNRDSIPVRLGRKTDDQSIEQVSEGPRPLVESSNWMPPEQTGIIVDDLDEGFSTDNPDLDVIPEWVPNFVKAFIPKPDIDQKLPVHRSGAIGYAWARETTEGAFGTYRRTTARIDSGGTESTAVYCYFKTEIPMPGTWKLDFYLPEANFNKTEAMKLRKAMVGEWRDTANQGIYGITLQFLDQEHEIEFDASVGSQGWNQLGEFELPVAPVTVRISNKSDGDTLFADAIRWTPPAS
ncbi:MAG: hypothetical protein OXC80_11445 [Gammaproteobacteria bacterium]|nr:hypothetical protein [Gammaproteobacteria bacterium]